MPGPSAPIQPKIAIRSGLVRPGAWAGMAATLGMLCPLPAEEDPQPPAYEQWISSYQGLTETAADEDPDADGIQNGIEFILGSDPDVPDSPEILPKGEIVTIAPGEDEFVPAGTYLRFTWARADRSAGDNPGVVYSTDLTDWLPAEGGEDGIVVREFAEDFGPLLDRVETYLPVALAENGRLFARLKITVP